MRKAKTISPVLRDVIMWLRETLIALFVVSGVINILALTGSFYMLQIYDRALTSRSIETLIAISALAIGLYLFQGILDITRSQVLVRMAARVDDRLAPAAHRVAMDMPRYGYSATEAIERARDVDTIRHFIAGQGPIALLDLPWMPLYLIFIYMLHPMLAFIVLGGGVILALLTLLTEISTRQHSSAMHKAAAERATILDANVRNVEVIRTMGFLGRSVQRFDDINRKHLALQLRTSDIGGTYSGIAKVLRMILQSAILGLGAYYTIKGELSAGSIIAASVASARALAPVDMVIGQWKGFVAARRSLKRLKDLMAVLEGDAARVSLPKPRNTLKVDKITVAAPGAGVVVLSDVSFELTSGQALGLIGPSASGKSSVARAIMGAWPLARGAVRLDGADISQWDADQLGGELGYLPQEVSLMDGTIAQNICRFDPNVDSEAIIAAATTAGVHEMILRLPDGYETAIGANGASLSAGQRQRLALARALYGNPFLVVLDEPNSNLDAEGEAALAEAIQVMRMLGSIVVVIAHRPSVLAAVDMVGIMQGGRLTAFGPKDEVLGQHVKTSRHGVMQGEKGTSNQGEQRWANRRS